MVAGAVANFLQPSVYDAMIEIKKLPFLQSTIDSQVCKLVLSSNLRAHE